MKIQHQMFVLLFICFWACGTDDDGSGPFIPSDDDSIVEIQDDTLAVAWCSPLSSDTSATTIQGPFSYEEKIIYTIDTPENATITAFDKSNGDRQWSWKGAIDYGRFPGFVNGAIHNNNLWIGAHSEIFAINLERGTSDLEYDPIVGCGNPRNNLIGNYFYFQSRTCGFNSDRSSLIRINTETKGLDTIFTVQKEDGYIPDIEATTFWENSDGDTILIFQNRSLNESTLNGRIDIYGYNLQKEELAFTIEDLVPLGNSSVHLPLVFHDRLYFQGVRDLFCIDLPTQEIVWQRNFNEFGEQLLVSNLLIVEDQFLIVNPDNENMYAFDPENGAIIWKKEDKGGNTSKMIYHDGILYFVSAGDGHLYSVRANTGITITKQKAPKLLSGAVSEGFSARVGIDPERKLLFASDFVYHYAFQIPN